MISQKELRRIKGALTLIAGFAIGIVNAIFGAGGGMVVATGTPSEIAKSKDSATGEFLRNIIH